MGRRTDKMDTPREGRSKIPNIMIASGLLLQLDNSEDRIFTSRFHTQPLGREAKG